MAKELGRFLTELLASNYYPRKFGSACTGFEGQHEAIVRWGRVIICKSQRASSLGRENDSGGGRRRVQQLWNRLRTRRLTSEDGVRYAPGRRVPNLATSGGWLPRTAFSGT